MIYAYVIIHPRHYPLRKGGLENTKVYSVCLLFHKNWEMMMDR
jgi:hypothetical protein